MDKDKIKNVLQKYGQVQAIDQESQKLREQNVIVDKNDIPQSEIPPPPPTTLTPHEDTKNAGETLKNQDILTNEQNSPERNREISGKLTKNQELLQKHGQLQQKKEKERETEKQSEHEKDE